MNIVPEHCAFDFEIRYLPGMDMKPMLLTDPQSAFIRSLAGWLQQWGQNDNLSTIAFCTEGGLFDEAGVLTLACGPGSMAARAQTGRVCQYRTAESLHVDAEPAL